MAPKAKKKDTTFFDNLITKEPKITVLSDNPVSLSDMKSNIFNFRYHLGPVYDIIRHEKTQMPLTIGINGKWGTGKTTAMQWLFDALEKWKQSDESKGKVKTRNLWFYPWNYHNKEDVWKGLITEVILNVTDFNNATPATVSKAVKLLSAFVGKSALDIISSMEFELPGFKVNGEVVKEIKDNFQAANHPETPYLNEYEDIFKKWIKDALSKTNERMVIFIDDLDRCMPDIALQVLEALKLYLKIDKLIFVMGMDRPVVEKAVRAYYKDKHIEDIDAGSYLGKMLQVELQLSPLQKEMEFYLDEQLQEVGFEENLEYEDGEGKKKFYELFKELISKYGGRNPREVKRLINSSLIRGAGAEKVEKEANTNALVFEQGVQIFFMQKILEQQWNRTELVGDGGNGDDFFTQWSKIVRENKEPNDKFPLTVKVPSDFGKELGEDMSLEEITHRRLDKTFLSFADEAYHNLLQDSNFSGLFQLLDDEDLGKLMQIEYSTTIAGVSKQQDSDLLKTDDAMIIKNAIAKKLKKEVQDLKEKDYDSLTSLNLRGKKVSDIAFLRRCKNLKELNLSGTGISNISILAELKKLTTLWLSENQISDISAIEGLGNLITLSLANNQISDISLLKALTNLTDLYLYNNQISDIQSLNQLINLRKLELSGNQISDIQSLKQLINLRRLDLGANQISDISPLSQLTNLTSLLLAGNQIEDVSVIEKLIVLQTLWLSHNNIKNISVLRKLISLDNLRLEHNRISDISVLEGLTSLVVLYLDHNQISDISAIGNLISLTGIFLSHNQISDISVLKGLTKLVMLDLNNTEVNDLTPIKGLDKLQYLYASTTQLGNIQVVSELTNLRSLGITNTKVRDLAPIKQLNNLEDLFFSDTPADTLEPLKELTNLQTLKIQKTQINSLEPIKGLSNLKEILLEGCEKITAEQIDDLQKALPDCKIPAAAIKGVLIGPNWRLFFNPKFPGLSKTKIMLFGEDGVIFEGRNINESSWRIRSGYLELLDSDAQVHSRFYYNPDKNRFDHTNDPDTGSIRKHSIRDQYMLPEK